MNCEKCGREIDAVLVATFNRDGSDCDILLPLVECEENAAYIDATQNWTGYELSDEEQMETVLCPRCKQFPFKSDEMQVYDVVRIVCFRQPAETEGET